MKKNIKIVIPDHLKPGEEAALISERLHQKMLAGNGVNETVKRLGQQIDIKHLTTTITIERVGEKPVEYVMCNVCNTEYQSDTSTPVWVNYGGKQKKVHTCSSICANDLIALCGSGRAALKKKDLKPFRFF